MTVGWGRGLVHRELYGVVLNFEHVFSHFPNPFLVFIFPNFHCDFFFFPTEHSLKFLLKFFIKDIFRIASIYKVQKLLQKLGPTPTKYHYHYSNIFQEAPV